MPTWGILVRTEGWAWVCLEHISSHPHCFTCLRRWGCHTKVWRLRKLLCICRHTNDSQWMKHKVKSRAWEGGLRVSSAEALGVAVSHLDLVLEEVESCERVWSWQLAQSDFLLERSPWQKWRGVKSQSRELLGGVSNDPGERPMVTSFKMVAVHRAVNALLGESQSLL